MNGSPVETVLTALRQQPNQQIVQRGAGWIARCPAHDDRNPSLSINAADDGRVLLNCLAGCATDAVLSSVGLTARELFPDDHRPDSAPTSMKPRKRRETGGFHGQDSGDTNRQMFPTCQAAIESLERTLGQMSAAWTYRRDDGSEAGAVIRWDTDDGGKEFRPLAKTRGGWIIRAMSEPRPLFQLPDIEAAEVVYVVEGEKAAQAGLSLDLITTTSVGGSNAAEQSDWTPLTGKDVVILPDHDDAGWKYAETVAGILSMLSPRPTVRIVDLSEDWQELPEKGDLHDWCEAHDVVEPSTLRERIEAMADRTAVWEPDRPKPLVEPYKSFPLELLPEPVRGFVQAGSKAIGCDPAFIATPMLSVLGAAIGNTRRVRLKPGWDAPPIIWTAVIGKSGTMKSPAWSLAMSPVDSIERDADRRHQQDLAAYQVELDDWKQQSGKPSRKAAGCEDNPPREPTAERFSVADTTVEALAPLHVDNPRGLLLSRDELSGWLASFDRFTRGGRSSSDAANWLSMFNAKPLRVDRKSGEPRTLFVESAAVNICGGIQPGTLRKAIGAEHRENGLLARFLLAWPPQRMKRWTEAGVDPSAVDAVTELVRSLRGLDFELDRHGEPTPGVVTLTSEAKSLFRDFYNEHAQEQEGLDDDLSAAWSKLEEYAARLALIIHLIRCATDDKLDADQVDAESMSAGISLTRWFSHETRRVYGLLDQSDADRQRDELIDWIRRRGGNVSVPDVQGGHRRFETASATEAALNELVVSGFGEWVPVETTPRGGRPTRRFRLCEI